MTLRVEEVAQIPPASRRAYLASLSEPQELFVEQRVGAGRGLVLRDGGGKVGHAVVHGGTVVELFWPEDDAAARARALARVLERGPADRVLIQSFDTHTLTAAVSLGGRSRHLGHLFRHYVPPRADDRNLVARFATFADLAAVAAMHDGFFDDDAEMESYVATRGLIVFSLGEALVGCGVFRRVVPEQPVVDVGMVVAREHRGRQLGATIAAHVAAHCVHAALRPIAGCGVDNPASRRSLLRAGFVETHALIEVDYGRS